MTRIILSSLLLLGLSACGNEPSGKTATKLAFRSYVRSILSSMTDVTLKLGSFSLATGIIVPLLAGALALLYASRRLAKTDVA